MNRLELALLLAPLLGACGLIDAATSDMPNTTQSRAIGDVFGQTASFVKVASDPATATESDLRDVHLTEPYKRALDPAGKGTERRLAGTDSNRPLDAACFTHEGNSATWNCALITDGINCMAVGNGSKSGDAFSGTSTLTCTGLPAVTVTAQNVVFDEAAGRGSGVLTIQVANPSIAGWATVNIDGLGFCVDAADPAPNSGHVTIDGQGILDRLPFDPLTVKFSDDPVCGTALID